VPFAWLVAALFGLGYSLSMVVADLRARRFGTDVLAVLGLAGNSSWGSTSRVR